MTTWTGKDVLVTGAGGFIGSHLVESLVKSGARVSAFVHYNSAGSWGWLDRSSLKDEIHVIAGDIVDPEIVEHSVKGRNTVFHLAALIGIPYSYQASRSYVRTNVEGTLNVLLASAKAGVDRLVHTSTSEVYGTAQTIPISEDHPLQGQSPYSASKIAADKLTESFHNSFGLKVTTVRPFNTYGPRQSARAIIPTIISQCLAGRDTLTLGNLSPSRDFSYVTDTVQGFIEASRCDALIGETVNLGNGEEISIDDLARKILRLTDSGASIEQDESRVRVVGSEVERLKADATKMKRSTDWHPTVDLDDGLSRTIDWMRDHLDRYRPNVYTV